MVLPRDGFAQPVEVVVDSMLPRAGFVQPVEVVNGVSPPGTWTLVDSGTYVLPDATTATLKANVQPAAGQALMAIVSPSGAGDSSIHNDNTNQQPGTRDVHWCLTENGVGVDLVVRSGNQGGCTLYWALYAVVPQ